MSAALSGCYPPHMTYAFLILAILCEAGWATSMKLAHGFTRPGPAAIMLVFYLASLFFLTLAARKLDISIAYALWVGAGMSLIAIIGILYFREPVTLLKLASLALIAAGIVGLHYADYQIRSEAKEHLKALAHHG